mgnify:CR=1 FL=1
MRCRPEGGWRVDQGKDDKVDLIHPCYRRDETLSGAAPNEDGWREASLCLEYRVDLMSMSAFNERFGLRPLDREVGEWPASDVCVIPGPFDNERGPYDPAPNPMEGDP